MASFSLAKTRLMLEILGMESAYIERPTISFGSTQIRPFLSQGKPHVFLRSSEDTFMIEKNMFTRIIGAALKRGEYLLRSRPLQ